MNLLTLNNRKITKSLKGRFKNYQVGILHLRPHKSSGIANICPKASQGCIASCLNTSGFGRYNSVQQARQRRTELFFNNRDEFKKLLDQDISKLVKMGKTLVRLNGTSDLPWEDLFPEIFVKYPQVKFYDYTKVEKRMMKFLDGRMPPNYHLTFSRSEINQEQCERVLKAGGNVAVVFDKQPKEWLGVKTINGDNSDFRCFDKSPRVVSLRPKGKARSDNSGFVIRLEKKLKKMKGKNNG